MPYDPDRISAKIKVLAAEKGSERALAAASGLDPKTINNAVNKAHGMTIRTAYMIAKGAGISVAELLGEESPALTDADEQTIIALRHLLKFAEQRASAAEAVSQAAPPQPEKQKIRR